MILHGMHANVMLDVTRIMQSVPGLYTLSHHSERPIMHTPAGYYGGAVTILYYRKHEHVSPIYVEMGYLIRHDIVSDQISTGVPAISTEMSASHDVQI